MTRLQANALLLLTAMIWGMGFVVQQICTGNLGTISFTGARFLLGGLVVLPFALRQYHRIKSSYRFSSADFLLLLQVGSVLFIAAALQQYGILRTSVTNSGFLTGLYVPLVPTLGLLIIRKKVHWAVWPASFLCVAGTYVISGSNQLQLQQGDLWVIASTIFWAGHVLLVGFMAKKTNAPLIVASSQFCICGVLGLVFGTFIERSTLADYLGSLPGILYVGLFSVGLAFTFQVIGQRHTQPADAAILLSSETVFAALAGVIFLHEPFTTKQFAGASLILLGILTVELLPLSRIGKPQTLS